MRLGSRTGQAGRRWRTASAVVAVALVASMLSGAGVDRSGLAAQPAARVPVSEAPDVATAARAARAQGSRVEAVDLRTQIRTVYAEPDGTMTAELTARPVRVARDESWVDEDTTLVRRRDGSVGPAAAAVGLPFSDGGADGPLVRYGKGDRWIELVWPGELPEPTLAGDTATYAEVLPGWTCSYGADLDGFAHYLVIKDRAAAVAEVRLGLRTRGVRLRATGSGGLEARDADGAVVFAAAVSQMWDSGTPPRRSQVGVAVAGDSLVLPTRSAGPPGPATRRRSGGRPRGPW